MHVQWCHVMMKVWCNEMSYYCCSGYQMGLRFKPLSRFILLVFLVLFWLFSWTKYPLCPWSVHCPIGWYVEGEFACITIPFLTSPCVTAHLCSLTWCLMLFLFHLCMYAHNHTQPYILHLSLFFLQVFIWCSLGWSVTYSKIWILGPHLLVCMCPLFV